MNNGLMDGLIDRQRKKYIERWADLQREKESQKEREIEQIHTNRRDVQNRKIWNGGRQIKGNNKKKEELKWRRRTSQN